MSDTPRTDAIDYLAPDTDSDPARSWMASYIDMKNLSMELERELNARDSCSTGSTQGTPGTPAVTPAKPALGAWEMHKTPLTDAEAVRFARILVDFHEGAKVTELVPADFARNLERKLRDDQRIIGELMDRALTAENAHLSVRRKALLDAIATIRPQPGPEPRDYTAWHEARRVQEWCVKQIDGLLK